MTQCPACTSAVEPGQDCPQCGTASEQSQTTLQSPQGQTANAPQGHQHRQSRQHQHRQSRQRQPQSSHRHPLPTGIKLLCGLLVLSGLGTLALALQVQSMSQTATAYGAQSAGGTMGLVALLAFVFGAGELAAAFGLWTRKSWGWTAGMGVAACGLLTSLFMLTNPLTSGFGLLGVLYNVGLGWYVYGHRWLFAGQPRPQPAPTNRTQTARREQ